MTPADREDLDPTANVLQLVAAEARRQDDLREAEAKHRDAIADLERQLRARLGELESKYRDAQSVAEARRLDAIIAGLEAATRIAATEARLTAQALADRVESAARTLASAQGAKEQGQWTTERILTVVGLGAAALYFILSRPPAA